MNQLIMRWVNNGLPAALPQMPENHRIAKFTELESAMEIWLDIVQYGLSNGLMDEDFYQKNMTEEPFYEEDKCFFILEDKRAIATITVICNYESKEGYIHMVACREDCRGKGYGTMLNRIAEYVLKKEGMKTAYLTTDDWRIPAIKSYLRIGFSPDLSTEEFKERWDKIFREIGR